MFALTPVEQRTKLEEFCRKTKILLTNQERDSLHDILKQYQTYRDVHRLIAHLCSVLNSPQKLDLLREVRNLIPLSHVSEFDQLAPYSRMMHAYHPVGIIAETTPSVGRGRMVVDQRSNHEQSKEHVQSTEDVGCKLVICSKREDGGLGFSIKENPGRSGVIVSHVIPGSHAEKNGLKVGSQILDVNGIDFKNITLPHALLVLQGSEHLHIKIMNARPVIRTMIITGDSETTWVDTMNCKKVSTEYKMDSCQIDSASGHERRVVLQLSDGHKFIGFNIRGGIEYGLGIYISRVDKGGLAETNGIRVGDQIISVNGESFEHITHTQAVEFIKNLRHLILTLRNMNRYPAYKKTTRGPASVHLPVTEVIVSAPFKDTKPKQPTAEIKPLPPTIVFEPPLLASKSKPTLSDNGIVQNSVEKSEPSIVTEPSGSVGQKLADSMLSVCASDDIKPTSQSSIATQTLKVSSPPLVPTADVLTMSGRMTTPPSTRKQPMTVMGTSALTSPHRKIGRSTSMKVSGEKVSPLLVNSPATKSKKVQRNRSFREVLFRMNVKHTDKEKIIEKNKVKERNKEKTTKEKKDRHSNCLFRDNEETQRREHCHHKELERLRRERQEEVRQLRIKAQDKDHVSTNMVEYGHIPLALWSTHETDNSDTVCKKHKEPRQGHDNLAATEGSSRVRRNSNNEVGHKAMTKYLNLSKNVSTNCKSHVIKPTSPPPPPPYMPTKLPSPLPKYSATKLPCIPTKPATPCSPVQPPVSVCTHTSSPPSDTRILPYESQISVSLAPDVNILMSSPQTSKFPPTHLSTFHQPPLPSPNSTFSPSLPTQVLETSPDAVVPHKDISPLHPPPTAESLTLPVPQMSTHPFCMTQLSKSSPLPPPVSPLPPSYLSSEKFLMATKIDNNLNTITDKSKSFSDSHICGNINNMSIGNETLSKTKTENIPEVCVTTAADKQCVFTVPLVAKDVLHKYVTDDKDDELGGDVDLPKFSNNDDSSGNHTVESKDGETNSHNFIKELGGETTNTSFEAVTSPPIDSISNSFSAAIKISQTNSNIKDWFIGDKVNETRKPAGPEAVRVEFYEAPEKELENRRSSSRVSFGEYQGSPLPTKKGILKNSFNRQEGAPTIKTSNAISDSISISSDDEPSPLKEITSHAKRRVQENLLMPSTDDVTSCSSPWMGRKTMTVELPKIRSSIGISIAGGREIQAHPMIKIDKVFPGGAAADNGLPKPGFVVLSVDDTPLTSATHCEAVDIIRRAYNDKNKPTIEFVVIPYQ